jgi:DNA-3-methyladenine glycosylase
VAPDLLGKLIVVDRGGPVVARITETEAYVRGDPASHSFGGVTARNQVMFGPPGRLYVYLSYGIHVCANVVTGVEGDGQAVLLRAAVPVTGLDIVRERRHGRPDHRLADGPGKLCAALGIMLGDNGVDLTATGSSIRLVDDGTPPPNEPLAGRRVGISKAVETPWRFRIPTR